MLAGATAVAVGTASFADVYAPGSGTSSALARNRDERALTGAVRP